MRWATIPVHHGAVGRDAETPSGRLARTAAEPPACLVAWAS